MLDAGRFHLESGRFRAAHDFFGQGRCGYVDFLDGNPHELIAHRAADHARCFAVAIKQREQTRDFPLFEPGRLAELRSFGHRVAPGTNLPPSICAGT